MSKYSEETTQFKDAGLLVECLKDTFKEVCQFETARQLEGYHGDKRQETAEIIVPRRAVGSASNDIGFKRSSDGSFVAIISDFDRHKHGAEFMKQLKLSYTEKFYMQRAAKAGLKYIGSKKTAGGKNQLLFVKA